MRALALNAVIAITMVVAIACSGPSSGVPSPTAISTATSVRTTTTPTPTPPDLTATATITPPPPSPTTTVTPTASPTPTATPRPTQPAIATPDPDALAITALRLNDIDDRRLNHLSVSEHPYFGGYTRVHGTIALNGTGDLIDLVLDVVASDTVITTTALTPQARNVLIQPFGDDRLIELNESMLLFEIPSVELHPIDLAAETFVTLRIRAQSSTGEVAEREYGQVLTLVRYTKGNRYFIGEAHQGGNDWVRPAVRAYIEQLDGVLAGDFSNMNGGPFPPHFTHQSGTDIDLWFEGYNNLNAGTAERLLTIINQPEHVARIQAIFVAYEQIDGDPFYDAIKHVILADGRRAVSVIHSELEHGTHFHVRVFY